MRERPLAHNFARLVEQADLVLCRAPVDASEPAECLISHGPVLSCPTSRHDACRNLYGRSRARLPTGHPSWPACRCTDPRLVLVARGHGWSLPAGRLARSAYTCTDRALPRYRGTDAAVIATVEDGNIALFVVVEHWNAEALGWHVAEKADRFAAAQALDLAIHPACGAGRADAARGLLLRHDHGSAFMSDHFQNQIAFLGMTPSFAFVREPETNGVAERFIRTLKEQVVWGRIFRNAE